MVEDVIFAPGDRVVYPAHGVGEVVCIEDHIINGNTIKVYVISFTQDKMLLKVPVNRVSISGLRSISSKDDLEKIYQALKSKPQSGNKMWSRRAQEYECKINSGDVIAVAEVLRDLYKNIDNDRSYSERTIYESALNRLACELALLEDITTDEAINKLLDTLKSKVAA